MYRISWLNLIQILTAFQALFFSLFLLFQSKGKRSGNTALALLLGLFAAQVATLAFRHPEGLSGQIALPQVSALLYGPLLYLYVQHVVWREFHFARPHAMHLVPFGVAVLAWSSSALLPPVLAVTVFASMTSYVTLSFATLRRYRRVLEATRSDVASITLNWLRLALAIITAIVVLDVLSFVTSSLSLGIGADLIVSAMLFLLLFLFVNLLVFKGLRHPELFAGITSADQVVAEALRTVGEDDFTTGEVRRVKDGMDSARYFLNPNLTLAELSADLGIPARRLSRLIKYRFARNFSDFVNGYRIQEAMTRLTDPERSRETILEIAYAVGFNSKSSFNAAFKRKVGVTPSEFRVSFQRVEPPIQR